MSKLFVFGIGGTGSRVLKSLTMLLQSGVKMGVNEIVPIVIDKDNTNGDLVRTKRMIDTYIETRNDFVLRDNDSFFAVKMSLIGEQLCIQLTDDVQKFSDYIGFSKLSRENQAMTEALFSKDALAMDTTEGFRGIPSIGSVVLNQLESNPIFQTFAKQFQQGDKIFIVSSIFGGTGASGFPLLIKTLRSSSQVLSNWNFVQNAPIGAVSVLPYFSVGHTTKVGEVNVDSDTFEDKAKAALDYYAKNIGQNLDVLYYVADHQKSTYAYNVGGNGQQNKAQITELLAALSIIDFSIHGQRNNTQYKEFGIITPQQNSDEIIFDDLHDDTQKIICAPLVQFYVFTQYMNLVFDEQNRHQPWSHNCWCRKKEDFDKTFKQSGGMKKLLECMKNFNDWLNEMNDREVHSHRFAPFNLESKTFAFVRGGADHIAINKPDFRYANWAWLDNVLNGYATKKELKVSESLTKEQKFLELFYRTTKKFVEKIIPNSKNWY